MASPALIHCLLAVSILSGVAQAQLSTKFYSTSYHNLQDIVWAKMKHAVDQESRIGASILRLFFHDCFVQGCDASVLLDGAGGEKWAEPNANSLRGFEIVDAIKASVEAACPGVVSCADILALAARDGTSLLGGPYWDVLLGRRDSTTASKSLAEANLPGAGFSLAELISLFARHRLTPTDLTVLSGAHTLGMARCHSFRGRIYNDTSIVASYATALRRTCPMYGGDGNLAPMDVRTPTAFDAAYFQNLMSRRGLLHSDQVLFNGGSQDSLVRRYSRNPALFRDDFARAMVKMGNINPLTGAAGQIRKNCRIVNR